MIAGKLYTQSGLSFGRYVYEQLKRDEYGFCGLRRHIGNLEKGVIVLVLETFNNSAGYMLFAHVLAPNFGRVFIMIGPGWEECKS